MSINDMKRVPQQEFTWHVVLYNPIDIGKVKAAGSHIGATENASWSLDELVVNLGSLL